MKSLYISKIKNAKIISSYEALKEIEIIEWSDEVINGEVKLIISLVEMKLMRENILPKKSWAELKAELKEI